MGVDNVHCMCSKYVCITPYVIVITNRKAAHGSAEFGVCFFVVDESPNTASIYICKTQRLHYTRALLMANKPGMHISSTMI